MFIFTVIAVLLASLIIAYKEDLKPCETVWPVCIVMILMLYILAFFRYMWVIDYISIVFSGIMLIVVEPFSERSLIGHPSVLRSAS